MIGKDYRGFPYLRLYILFISCQLAFYYLHDKIFHEQNLKGNCNCGSSNAGNPFERVEEMNKRDRHPWFVRVFSLDRQSNSTYSCGGSLVSSRHVVTAAHCLIDKNGAPRNKSQIFVNFRPERSSIFRPKAPALVQISNFSVHEDYDAAVGYEGKAIDSRWFFDIAVIELEHEVNLRVFTPICMAKEGHHIGEHAEVLTFKNKKIVDYHSKENYEEATKNLIIKEFCDYPFYKSGENVDHLCARGDAMEKGDSGGPMMVKNRQTDQYIMVGIVSRGSPFNYEMEYVYTKVASFRPWILKQMKSPTFCGNGPIAGYPLVEIVQCPLLPFIRSGLQFARNHFDFFVCCVLAVDLPLRLLSYLQRTPKNEMILPLSYKDLQ